MVFIQSMSCPPPLLSVKFPIEVGFSSAFLVRLKGESVELLWGSFCVEIPSVATLEK